MNRNAAAQMLGKYQLLERLGQGGMAQVYRARQPVIERDVAIKVLHPHLAGRDNFVERFKREARGLGQLRHPNIVSVIDFDTATQPGAAPGEADYYLVMDFIAGPTLADLLRERGPLPLEETLLIGEQIADALAYAHQQGIIHRDVKPGNIMFRDPVHKRGNSGGPQHPVLTDFGIVHLLEDAALTMSGVLAGTPAYLSPEAADGAAVDQRADLYSLGVVLYEMLTGEPPYKGDTPVRVMMQHITAPLPPLAAQRPDLPDLVVQIVERALAKEPDERFQRAETLRQALVQARLALTDGRAPLTQMLPAQTIVVEPLTQPRVDSQPTSKAHTGEKRQAAPQRLAHAPTPLTAIPVGKQTEEPVPQRGASRLLLIAFLVILLGGVLSLSDTFSLVEATDKAATLSGEAVGRLQITPTTTGQTLTITIDDLAAPSTDQHYHAWIVAQDGLLFDLGRLTINAGKIQHITVAEQNVLGVLDRLLITQEGTASPVAPAGQVILRAELTVPARTALTHLWVASPLPLAKPLLSAVNEQSAIAQDHVQMLNDALQAGDLPLAQRHAEHVVNILDGETGAVFGDLNLDGQAQNPGDGVGVRTYLTATAEAFVTLAVDRNVVDTALTAMANISAAARQVAAADTLAEAQRTAAPIAGALEQLWHGFDQDGSGAIEPERGEGALYAMNALATALATIPLYRVE
ncbi:MAG: serine/threonine protein kinase [Caldilinea sp. CFX5]|nr:serine/threonine protein kinase [Caldilinea sp. CFX5]